MFQQVIVEVSAEFIGFMAPIILVLIAYQAMRINFKKSHK